VALKLSTKGRYGVMACYDLARHSPEAPVPLKAIAERQGLSEGYLEHLLGSLRRAGLVRSARGPQGGYALARKPENMTVGDIIRVLEGPIAPVDCVAEDGAEVEPCARTDECVTRVIWEKLRDSMTSVLDSITLADLVREAGDRQAAAGEAGCCGGRPAGGPCGTGPRKTGGT